MISCFLFFENAVIKRGSLADCAIDVSQPMAALSSNLDDKLSTPRCPLGAKKRHF